MPNDTDKLRELQIHYYAGCAEFSPLSEQDDAFLDTIARRRQKLTPKQSDKLDQMWKWVCG